MVQIAVDDMDAPSLDDINDLVRSGKFDLAKWAYSTIVENNPENAAAWYGLGVVLNQLNNREKSISAFQKSYELDSQHGPTSANLAILYSIDNPGNADKYARIAINLGVVNETLTGLCIEEEPPLMEAKAVVEPPSLEKRELTIIEDSCKLILDGEFEEALDLISPAVEGEFQSSSELWTICSLCLLKLDFVSDANNSIKFAADLPPSNWAKNEYYIKVLNLFECETSQELMMKIELLNTDESEEDFSETDDISDENESISNVDEEIINEGIELEDSKVVLITNAKKCTEDGDHVSAVQIWKNILERFGSTSEAWRGMASALEAAGHIEKSKQCISKAQEIESELNIDNENDDVDLISAAESARMQTIANQYEPKDDVNVSIEWYNKGLNLLGEAKSSEALHCFEQSIKTIPREEKDLRVRVHNGKGHALHQMGEFSQSIQAYHQAISMSPESVTSRTLYNMGSSYAAMEHFRDAIKCFEQALDRDMDPDDTELCKAQMNRCQLLLKEQIKLERN